MFKEIYKRVRQISIKNKVDFYLVGGYLRDKLLNKKSYDVDFVVFADAINFAKEVAKNFKNAELIKWHTHNSAKIIIPFLKKIWIVDISANRAPTIKNDLKLRDFTINTFTYNYSYPIKKSYILDYLNAKADLRAKTLKEPYSLSFNDDPVRIIRAFRIAGKYNFKFSKSLKNNIIKKKHLISKATKERLTEEWFNILQSNKSYKIIREMDKLGILSKMFPEINKMKGVTQSLYHHLDVFEHSLETIRILDYILKRINFLPKKIKNDIKKYMNSYVTKYKSNKLALLKTAALFHDIAKPETKEVKTNGKISFYGHDIISENIFKKSIKALSFSNNEIQTVSTLIRLHLRPGFLFNGENLPTKRAIHRFYRDCKYDTVGVVIFSLADRLAALGEKITKTILKNHKCMVKYLLKYYFNEYTKVPLPKLISGHDIMNKFNLSPGPLIGRILEEVREAQLEKIISTKQQALEYAQHFLYNNNLKKAQ